MRDNNVDMLARVPNQLALEPVPERFGNVFKKIDAKGLHADAKGNSIYEILDAPLGQVATALQKDLLDRCHDGDLNGDLDSCEPTFTLEESEFLQKLGISGDGRFDVDPKMARLWGDRLAINKSLPGDGKVELADIKVDLSKLTGFSGAEKVEIETVLKGVLFRISQAAQLGKDEVPSIMVVPDTLGNNLAIATDSNHARPVIDLCKIFFAEMQKRPLNHESLNGLSTNLMGEFVYNAETLPKKSIIIIPETLLSSDFKALFQIKGQLASNSEAIDLITSKFESNYGFLIAHEIGHLFEYSKYVLSHEISVAKIMYENVLKENQFIFGTFICTQFHDTNMLEDLVNDPRGFRPGTLRKIKKEYHSKEYEAHIIGVLLASKAGFDPDGFGVNFLPQEPEAITHPAERHSKRFIRETLRQYSLDMGM